MSLESEIIELKSNPKMMDLFRKILKSRVLSKSQLIDEQIDGPTLEGALQGLQKLGLINERRSTYKDFNRYYPTQEGLEIEKMVR